MLAENSISKMAVKPVVATDIVKQQKELEEQRRQMKQQQEEVGNVYLSRDDVSSEQVCLFFIFDLICSAP